MQTVESVAAIRSQLHDAGFRPVSVLTNDKRPIGNDWAERARQDPPPAVAFSPVPHALNTGILCDGLRAIDLDIDDKEIAARCRAIVMQRFGEAPIRMRRNSSRCLILYRAESGEPRKLVLSGELGKVEVLGRGQQFVAFGGHPSGAALEWFPDAPGTEPLSSLPPISETDLIETLAELAPIIKASAIPGHETERQSSEPEACPLRIATALNAIPNAGPADWEAWNRVGMATWRATVGSEMGWQAFNAWSERHPSYDPTETRARWEHYRTSPPTQIGAGSLFHMAEQAKPKEPPPKQFDHALFEVEYFRDIKPPEDTADFVENLLIAGSMVVIYGESNSGKTFFATDLFLHVACGWEWNNRQVERGAIIYCALEGSHGIRKRVVAFREEYGLGSHDIPFAVIPVGMNLLDPDADASKLIATIAHEAAKLGLPVRAVVMDTLSRAMAGGNENGPEDMGALVTNGSRIQQETGACVVWIHHSGKDAARGARGHSLLRAATDTEIEIVSDGQNRTATVTKQRDLECEGEFGFTLKPVEVGTNRRGKPIISCVVVKQEVDKSGQTATKDPRLAPNASLAMRALTAAMAKAGAKLPPTPDYPHDTIAVSAAVWREEFYHLKSGEQSAKIKAFSRAEDMLLARNLITQRNGLVWFASRKRQVDNQVDTSGH